MRRTPCFAKTACSHSESNFLNKQLFVDSERISKLSTQTLPLNNRILSRAFVHLSKRFSHDDIDECLRTVSGAYPWQPKIEREKCQQLRWWWAATTFANKGQSTSATNAVFSLRPHVHTAQVTSWKSKSLWTLRELASFQLKPLLWTTEPFLELSCTFHNDIDE